MVWLALKHVDEFICSFYVAFNSQGHIAMGSLQVEETSAYCNVNHRALPSNYQLSNMKYPARDSNRRPQRLKPRTLNCYTTEPPLKHVDFIYLFIYLGFYLAFNTVQVISRQVVGRAEETSTYSSLGFCTVNCQPTASNYQLSHLRPCQGSNPGLRGGRRECYHPATMAPLKHVEDRYIYIYIYIYILRGR